VLYEGEDTWRPETKRKAPATFDTPISSFSILVRLPNMEPLSPANQQSWRDFQMNNEKDDSWVNFEGIARIPDLPPADWGKRYVDLTRRFLIHDSLGWSVQRLEEKRYGLTTEVQIGPDKRAIDIRVEDLMYDEHTWNTIIECGAGGLALGGHHICKHFFLMPEMNLVIAVQYHRNRLPEWAAIQKKVDALVKSFLISSVNK